MSTLKIDALKNNGSAIDLPNGIKVGGNEIVQGYTSSGTEPVSPVTGDFWWDSTNEELYQYVNGEFKAIGIVASGWTADLSSASQGSVSFSVGSQAVAPFGLVFNSDGSKMYVADLGENSVYQYSLSTSFNLSTTSYDNSSFSFSSQFGSNLTGISISPDGTKMYAATYNGNSVYQYTLSTPYDVSTASYDSVSFSASSQSTSIRDVFITSDGAKMYITGGLNYSIFEYTLSTPYDLSSASYEGGFSVFSQETAPTGMALNPEGTQMFVIGSTSDSVHQYTLSTAYDVTSASYDSVSISVNSQESIPQALAFSTNGAKLFVIGYSTDTVYQYSTGL